jgi:hypothetical protein
MFNVTTSFTTIADAPDFSVPDAAEQYTTRDPLDASRAIRPGEIFFLTPLSATNKGSTTQWIEAQLVAENGTTIQFARVEVPAGDTAFIPLQGRSLFKRVAAGTNGDRIQVRAQSNSTFDVWAAAEEKLSAEHAGVV